jgi:DNA-binding Lrp family transcriptional regulator
MAQQPLSPEMLQQAVDAYSKFGSQPKAADFLGISRPTLQHRLREAERRGEAKIPAILDTEFPGRLTLDIENGSVLIGSDAHYWPGVISSAHRAFVRAIKEFRPTAVIMNGDAFDGASVSRHAPGQWEDRPTVIQELEACKARIGEIEDAAGNVPLLWPLGNHDARFESRLASVVPEYADVHGMHLKDHFPRWAPCWSVEINDGPIIKHRWKGGKNGVLNNTIEAGRSIITGHDHGLRVSPFTDYNGTRYGVSTGTLAPIYGPQFTYTEDNPRSWRGGSILATFVDGELLWPEPIYTMDEQSGKVGFRNKVFHV